MDKEWMGSFRVTMRGVCGESLKFRDVMYYLPEPPVVPAWKEGDWAMVQISGMTEYPQFIAIKKSDKGGEQLIYASSLHRLPEPSQNCYLDNLRDEVVKEFERAVNGFFDDFPQATISHRWRKALEAFETYRAAR